MCVCLCPCMHPRASRRAALCLKNKAKPSEAQIYILKPQPVYDSCTYVQPELSTPLPVVGRKAQAG